jgi:hypothetical protein
VVAYGDNRLVVATYFAARHIPGWLFAVVILLYALTSASAVVEVPIYGDLVENYGRRLAEIRAASHISRVQVDPGSGLANFNGIVNYAVFTIGAFSAASFSFLHWRRARNG